MSEAEALIGVGEEKTNTHPENLIAVARVVCQMKLCVVVEVN